VDQACFLESAAGATVYGAKHPGSENTAKYARIKGTAQLANAAFDVPADLNDMDDQAVITDAIRLRVIAVKNGVVLLRVGNATVPGADEFRQTDVDTVEFGDAITVDDLIELFVLDALDIVTISGGALTAGRIYEATVYDFMTADAPTNLTNAV
jgi:hypothetical protein